MTAQDAYLRVLQKNPGFYGSEAIDFGSFFMFQLRPIGVTKDDSYFTGTVYPIVDKKSGKVTEYDILNDPDTYLSAKRIPIKNVFDLKVS